MLNLAIPCGTPEFPRVPVISILVFRLGSIAIPAEAQASASPVLRDLLGLDVFANAANSDQQGHWRGMPVGVDRATADLYRSPEITALYDRWFLRPVPPRGLNYNVPLSSADSGLTIGTRSLSSCLTRMLGSMPKMSPTTP